MLVNLLLLEPVNLLNHRSNINSIVTVVNLVVVCSEGLFINDGMQLEGSKGSRFSDTLYEGLSKISKIVEKEGEGVRQSPNMSDVING